MNNARKNKNNKQTISFVLPCYNEEGNLLKLYTELNKVTQTNSINYEFIFVDDGSSDSTLEILQQLCEHDSRIRYISFSRNFGHQQALKAGIAEASGDAVIMMDTDLQHPPVIVPLLIEQWEKGYDVVNTIRIESQSTPYLKKSTSRFFYRLMNALTDIQIDEGSADFRLIDRKVAEVLKNCPEDDLFLRGMVSWCGFKQTKISYTAQVRYSGKTKYPFYKMFKFAVNGITSFSLRPLKLAILLSSFFTLLSIIEIIYVLYITIFTTQAVSGWASLALLISVMGAAILFMLGVIGEYLGKLFMQGKGRPQYIIKEKNYL
jgi:dolichol-phosphate mannosyltransferase